MTFKLGTICAQHGIKWRDEQVGFKPRSKRPSRTSHRQYFTTHPVVKSNYKLGVVFICWKKHSDVCYQIGKGLVGLETNKYSKYR